MATSDARAPIPRDRALVRLHRLTVASAALAVAATGAFATIAAASDHGTATKPDTTPDVRLDQELVLPDPTAEDHDDATSTVPAPILRPSTGRAHATTGGSS